MSTQNTDSTQSGDDTGTDLPNVVTIVGRGIPSNYELSVDGEIEMAADDPVQLTTTATSTAVEGAIEVGVERFRFSGELLNVRVQDWNGVDAPDSPSTPAVHVDYGISERR